MSFRHAAAGVLACAIGLVIAGGSIASEAPQGLPFAQDWSDTSLITVNNDWSGVPGIVGYRGDGMTSSTGVDPQTVLADGSGTPENVIANQTSPNTLTTGGVAEFHIAKPTVALQGSGTARAPHLVINLDTTGESGITVAYTVRDVDGSADDAVQPVALHYRVGASGNYTNIPAAFVADATEGPSLAGKTTPVSVVLPPDANDKPLVQVRIMTTDAAGSDEWVAIDDISVTSGTVEEPTGGPVVISEFRVRGPNGAADEFVELYNRSGAPVDIGGWLIRGSNSAGFVSTRATVPSGTILAPNCYYLATNSSTSGGPYSGSVPGDVTFATGITDDGGIGLTMADLTLVDAVGMSTGSAFKEGTPLANLGSANLDRGYERKPGGAAGNGQDTDDNATDFQLLAPSNPQNSMSTCLPEGVDVAPFVASTIPASNAIDVPVDSNITIEFSEPVTVSEGWYAIECQTSGSHTASESGGPVTYVLDPDADFAEAEDCTVTIVAANVADQDGEPQTMAADHVFSFRTAAPPTKISEIQGLAHISPLAGQQVSGVHGIVTARRSNGFYFQDPNPDDDHRTSEGLFVFTSSAPTVAVGDEVRVGGMVSEFRPGGIAATNLTITQLTGPSITTVSTGNPLPAPTIIGQNGRMAPTELIHPGCASGTVENCDVAFDPDSYGIDFYESLEGMLVQVEANAVVVGPTNNFGETVLLPDDGVWAGLRTNRFGIVVRDLTPAALGDYSQGDFNPERIMIDDEIVRPLPRVHVGDRLATAAVGVMDYSFGNFKVQVTSAPAYDAGGLQREVTRLPRDQELAVATFNVENLWPNPARGTEQFDQLADLIVNNLRSPDLIGIEEVQDNDGPAGASDPNGITDASVTWSMLIEAIERAGGPTYEHRQIDPIHLQDGGQPGGNIRVGFLFRSDRGLEFVDRPGGDAVTATQPVAHPSGVRLTLSPGRVDPQNPAWTSTRKPLAGEFKFRGKKVIAVVNHFSSKGGDDPLYGRFQPPVRHTEVARHQQAAVVNQFARDVLAVDPNALVVVNGDINDFDFSETVQILESGGAMETLMSTLPAPERYSYVFEGNAQVLDQTLASPALMARLVDYDVVHVNSEFHDQASDHEPQVARFWMIESDRPRR